MDHLDRVRRRTLQPHSRSDANHDDAYARIGMSKERRFSEREIAEIFEHASDAQKSARRQLSDGEGLTLEELQGIGRDVGIDSEHIARAAAVVARPSPTKEIGTTFGLPTRVSRTVKLPRSLTDQEWDRLVVDLRETFRARGEVRREGSLRQWTNGNLQALIEPRESGHRLRLRTFHENARFGLLSALVATTFCLVMLVGAAVTGNLEFNDGFRILAAIGVVSVFLTGFTAQRIRQWASERQGQMEGVATRVSEMLEPDTAAESKALGHDVVDLSGEEPDSEVKKGRSARRDRS